MTTTQSAPTATAAADPATATYRRFSDSQLLVGLTALSLLVNIVMEVGVILLQPDRTADFVGNVAAVTLYSLVGLALVWGLVRLGRRAAVRTPMAWTLAILGLAACVLFYFCALPTTLATGAYVLARSRAGSLQAARVVAIVGIVGSFIVSIAMIATYL